MQKLPLWERDVPLYTPEFGQDAPSLTPYLLHDGKLHGAVIVCPGGGYVMKADHEREPIALRMNQLGFHAFTLDYRVAPYTHPAPLLDAQRAIRYVRHHAERFGVLPDKIAILGFSAGGHLVCTAATQYDAGDASVADPVDRVSCRPDAFIPCYAVASMGQFRHEGSFYSLTGSTDFNLPLARKLSSENYVTDDTPPAFIWHTAEDGAVPVENSLRLSAALCAHGVTNELHVFPFGPHGVGLGDTRSDCPLCEDWSGLLGGFLAQLGF